VHVGARNCAQRGRASGPLVECSTALFLLADPASRQGARARPRANENIYLETGAAMTNDVLALINEIQRYAGNRQSDVARGAETAAFAALMVEKFGEGLVKAGYLLGVEDSEELKQVINRLVREIDPQYPTHLQYRFEARPAGLAINGTTH
jgi:hypothetical protein